MIIQAEFVRVGDYLSSPFFEGEVTEITDLRTGILLLTLDPGGVFPCQSNVDVEVQRPGITLEEAWTQPELLPSRGIPSSTELRRRMTVDVQLPDPDDPDQGRIW